MKNRSVFLPGNRIDLVVLDKNRHLNKCIRWMNNQEIIRWLSYPIMPINKLSEEKWFDRGSEDKSKLHLAIELKNGKYIGNIGLHRLDFLHRFAEIGILIGEKDEWGKGYGAEAVGSIVQYGFKKLNLRKIAYHVIAPNIGSMKVAQKNNFKEEARLKEQVYRDGQFHDTIILSQFRKDWEKANNTH